MGPVKLGMSPSEVSEALAPLPGALERHASRGETDYFFNNALQVEYGADGKVHFIGASFHPGCGCTFSLMGRDPWRMAAQELFAFLAELDGGDHQFTATEYLFPRIIVTLWEADLDYDHLGGQSRPVFAEVGVGNAAYLEAIRDL